MILTTDQLRTRGHEFALMHEVCEPSRLKVRFWPAFRSDMASLHEFAEQVSLSKGHCKQPAEDWLLDHIHFLETQSQEVMRNLPRATLHKLPRIRSTGQPRIYALCDDYLEHVDGCYDAHSFEQYVLSYQEVSVLRVAECWALPSALRVMIIRRLAKTMRDVRNRHEVCHFVSSLLGEMTKKQLSDDEVRALLERVARKQTLGPIEIVHIVRHLREQEPDIHVVQEWLAAYVGNSEESLDHIVSLEQQLQAELQVTCGNLVQSLHRLERLPWRKSFARLSHVEQILLSDITSEYKEIDEVSQNVLRTRVTDIAYQLHVPEPIVAQTAVYLAKERQHSANVGLKDASLVHYLLDPHGMTTMRKELCKVTRPRQLPQLAIRRKPMVSYVSASIVLLLGFIWLAGTLIASGTGVQPLAWLVIAVALVLPMSEWAVTTLHGLISRCCRPTTLLRYDFSDKLPNDAKTMVVMPIIWSSMEEVDDVMDRLLVHYLANRQKHIYFGVLADFADANEETQPGDEEIVAHAIKRIDALCNKYGFDLFFLFHRARLYNDVDEVFMGWERKRGKLVEFVELLSGKEDTSFTTIHGNKEVLSGIRYVFTADHDTQLPIGVVSRMAGTIHFPYNRPRLNKEETRVVEGFGVLQPRIGVNFASTQKSRFASLWSEEPGIDPYAFAVSNSYQDLFGHAVFVGKGIFDVEAFKKTLVDRIPDHHVLSHDVLEGGFLRTGLTSDIEVIESQPSTYYAFERRAHRWIRGDWQLIKWIGRTCKDRYGDSKKVDLCGLTRWQIIDNLRRSLMAPALFLVALLGLHLLPGRALVWEMIVLLTIFLPFFMACVHVVMGSGRVKSMKVSFLQCVVHLLTLPFAAILSVDAIIRTLYRLYVSKRKLLEWVTSALTDRSPARGRVFMYELAGYIVIAFFLGLAFLSGGSRTTAFAFAVIWLLARPIIVQLNRPPKSISHAWVEEAKPELRDLARHIWSFYERYVTREESWLPPDNVQYQPSELVAHRTSPTNIGIYLACTVASRDLHFTDTEAMLFRIESTLQTVESMEKWKGHLLNWYDTRSASPLTPRYVSTVDSGNFVAYLMVVRQALIECEEEEFASRIHMIIEKIDEIVEQTDFKALYNDDERLFCLGYHVDTEQKDTILYDLLASEARQASFVAISLGQVSVSHWFTLGRTMTMIDGCKTLLSWSGTMFEYLMPSLLMRTYPNTIWDSTYRAVVKRQKTYADGLKLPFGISESGYYAFDYQLNYQYRAFGVPGLGMQRGLENHQVIAPYATILALPHAKEAAVKALHSLESYDAKGTYGFYEAVDFTKTRMPRGADYQVVQSFMAHHQGMSMLTLVNLLQDDIMVNRFHRDPRVCSAELLLQERIPAKAAMLTEPLDQVKTLEFDCPSDESDRIFTEPTEALEVNVLSNGRLTSVNTNVGTGMLMWNSLAVTRWREDPVEDTSGPIVYLYDVVQDKAWSVTNFPCATGEMKTLFRLDKTVYEELYDDISTKLEVTIASNMDAQVRRLTLTNTGAQDRTLEVTSFLELALAHPSADSAHPAFNKLFIETNHDSGASCLVAKRRRREDEEEETWAVHTVYVDKHEISDYEFETDRAAFIGRGHSLQAPKALRTRLSGATGSVVDPAFVMRRSIQLPPQATATVYMVTGVAKEREEALAIVDHLREPRQADRAFHLAWVRTQIDLRQMHLTRKEAMHAHLLASRLLYTPPLSPLRREAILQNTLGQSSLWSHGISGDIPMFVVSVRHHADLPFVLTTACQHQYLSMLGVATELVILDETHGSYQDEFMHRVHDNLKNRGIWNPQRLIFLKTSHLSVEVRTLLFAAARVIIRAGGPSLKTQLRVNKRDLPEVPSALPMSMSTNKAIRLAAKGEFYNGWGGFVEGGKAYQMHVGEGVYLPRPWSNVLANPHFGCVVTELGTGYTWWHNSRECKLTPWTNDPVLDRPGECLYLRDIASNEIWTAAPKPNGDGRSYKVTHGFGQSAIEQLDGDIVHTMEITVPTEDPLKLMQLRLKNTSEEEKTISITYYVEWVLGVLREAQAPFIVTEWENGTLLAHNLYQETFRDATAFLHIAASGTVSYTGDRTDFIGRGKAQRPAALFQDKLSMKVGTFSNSCGAVQAQVKLPAGGETSVTILLGCTSSKEEVHRLVSKYSHPSAFADARIDVKKYWERTLGQVQVKTPDRGMDILLNGWLLYQALVCRLWARTAFYQAGGAFGFRDQLQDALAFLHVDPSIVRRQILINAAHQYKEGDVQHWWHIDTSKGIRTLFSDDLLWLPYAVSRYIEQTGDADILQEEVAFLHSDVLREGELERYEDTVISEEKGSVLEHCLRAIRHSLKYGEHGLPLMGIGDWNDGMSRIGAKGRGESVWLGWFLLDILKRFGRLEDGILSADVKAQFVEESANLAKHLNEKAWDGGWFRRAFTDAGTWLGSIESKECRIDAIAQSWSVISGGTTHDRMERAMRSFDRELVDRKLGLARLLTKAFSETKPSPGYIQGYPAGIRENGGQYTHGVIWGIVAWSMLGRRDKAFELFSMLNPISHTKTARDVETYGNEPYVMSADVYTAHPHEGRAGWSWYTGAAGWMYQAGLEHVLGVKRQENRLYITPCVPYDWESFEVNYRYGETLYAITIFSGENESFTWVVDGKNVGAAAYLELVDDGGVHKVEVFANTRKYGEEGGG
ncbi:GH36-type glycosyl hydrolase domain-containing protein [Ectobacillus sp. sgz5001026]|uniref:GH36-type glycosyl hydrolase domain-containing protein n=1 Tax=Ectobacillus sp. sgz5001026 TaxID=3242473 RepID=UPI0036D43454